MSPKGSSLTFTRSAAQPAGPHDAGLPLIMEQPPTRRLKVRTKYKLSRAPSGCVSKGLGRKIHAQSAIVQLEGESMPHGRGVKSGK